MRRIVGIALLMTCTTGWAIPVNWEFSDTTYGVLDVSGGIPVPGNPWPPEPGLVSGSFTYDADTGLFSNASITTPLQTYTATGPSTLDCFEYSIEAFCIGFPTQLLIHLAAPLTNEGGTVGLIPPDIAWGVDSGSGEIFCDTEEGCRFGLSSSRYSGIGGTLVGTVVPVPAALWLFLAAIAALGCRQRLSACS